LVRRRPPLQRTQNIKLRSEIDAFFGGPGDWKNANPTNGIPVAQYQEDASKSWKDLTRFSF